MGKRRNFQTVKKELDDYKKWLAQSEARVAKLEQVREDSFINSALYLQMKEDLDWKEKLLKSYEINIKSLRGEKKKIDEEFKQALRDNYKFMEHDGESDYFIGISENFHDAEEYIQLKNQKLEAEGKAEELNNMIAERDKEIERLQGEVANLKHALPTTTLLSPRMQKEYDDTIVKMDMYKRLYDKSSENLKEEKAKSERLSQEVQKLKLVLSSEPTIANISTEELETLSRNEIRKKTSEAVIGTPDPDYKVTFHDYYVPMTNSELIKKLHYVETISENRRTRIVELKRELQSKRYDKYSQEDAVTYLEALQKINNLQYHLSMYQDWYEKADKKNEELQQEITRLASTTLSPKESIQVIEQNIEEDKKLKKETQKKKGRPVSIDERERAVILELHRNGHSIREIAKQVGRSVGSVHKIINEQ